MRRDSCIAWGARRVLAVGIMMLVAACAGQRVSTVTAPANPVVADTNDFMIVRAGPDDTYASLADRYLRDRRLASVLADTNGAHLTTGQLVVVPKRPLHLGEVYPDGYQVVPILCYHQFTNGRPQNRMQVTAGAFEDQMRYLIDHGYRVVTLKDLEGFYSGTRPLPKRAVVITIDDGYRSVYDIAYPILRRLGLKATLFVYTDFTGGGGLSLTWAHMREMEQSGVIDIQSHSKTHTSMSPNGTEKVDAAYIKRVTTEIDVPQHVLKEHLGEPIRHFAYPYGDTSAEVVKLLQDDDYTLGLTVQRGGNASFTYPLLLRRDMIYSDHTLEDFRKFLSVYTKANLK